MELIGKIVKKRCGSATKIAQAFECQLNVYGIAVIAVTVSEETFADNP